MNLPEVSDGLVTIVLSFIGVVAWFTRVESRLGTASRDVDRLETRVTLHEARLTELDNRVMEKLLKIETMVAKLIGRLEGRDEASTSRTSDN